LTPQQQAGCATPDSELAKLGRRNAVITTLPVDGNEALDVIARSSVYAKPTTTAGYVRRLGRRPQGVARRAAAVLEPFGRAGRFEMAVQVLWASSRSC
jgi:hypothetical protein